MGAGYDKAGTLHLSRMGATIDDVMELLESMNERISTMKADLAALEMQVEKHKLRLVVIPTHNDVAMIRRSVLELQKVVTEYMPAVHLKESAVEVEEPPGVNSTLDEWKGDEDF